MKQVIKKILDISDKTYYNWKNQNRPIISLLEQCFTDIELTNFLKNFKKPYKIIYADRHFLRLFNTLIRYMISSKGSKALFSAIFNNEIHPTRSIDEYVLKEYNNNKIDDDDVINYFNNKPNDDLLLYIYENIENDWYMLIENISNRWMLIYFEIFKLSIEKNIFDEIFGDPNKNIDECVVPIKPKLFACYDNWELIEEKYFNLLLEIKESIIDGTYKELPKYSSFDNSFDLDTTPE